MNRRTFVIQSSLAAASATSFASAAGIAAKPNAVPKYTYLSDASHLSPNESVKGPARVLSLKGRSGINPTSIHSVISLQGGHTVNEPRGTLTLWFFALEDLAGSYFRDCMSIDDKFFSTYPFLSDHELARDVVSANFSLQWNRQSELRAKFFKGTSYFMPAERAWVHAAPFSYFRKHQWYQIALSWDAPAKTASLYVNGILLGKSDIFNRDFVRDTCGDALYTGCPALSHGRMDFYDRILDAEDLYKEYRSGATDYDVEIEKELRHHFAGADLKKFNFTPDKDWEKQLDIDFQNPSEQLSEFYVQGYTSAVKPAAGPGRFAGGNSEHTVWISRELGQPGCTCGAIRHLKEISILNMNGRL